MIAIPHYLKRIEDLGFGSVTEYQTFWNLKSDGEIGPVTARSLDAPRICSLQDKLETPSLAIEIAEQLDRSLFFFVEEHPTRITRQAFLNALTTAFSFWEDVIDVKFRQTTESRNANITIGLMRERPYGTLAKAHVGPPQTGRRYQQWYDNAEPWKVALNPSQGEIGLVHVIAHETGHTLGLGHLPYNQRTPQLMNPMYNPKIYKPQDQDISNAVRIFGKSNKPSPTPPSQPTPSIFYFKFPDGVIQGIPAKYHVEKP